MSPLPRPASSPLPRPATLSKLLFLVLGVTAVSASGEAPPGFLAMWGHYGSAPGEFYNCSDVAIGPSGLIYVADFANARIQRFLADGTYVDEWPTQPVDGAAVLPRTIAIDAGENVFVVAQTQDRIQKYTATGSLLLSWGGTGWSDGQFRYPAGIAIGPDGNVYVADSNNYRIQVFTDSGAHLRTFGPLSTPPAVLGLIGGVGVDASGNIFTSDTIANRVVKLSAGGETLLQWGTSGSSDGSFESPADLFVDATGNVYVVEVVFPPFEPSNHRAQKFTNDGVFLSRWGELGTDPGQFDDPHGIAVDAVGHVYVADTKNHRVQKFGDDTTVAVLLADFEASFQGDAVELRWSAGLTGDATFAIWRAQDPGTGFEKLGEIAGHRGERTFSFLDTSARPQASYRYKLGVRQGAEVTYSEEVRVTTGAADFWLTAGPNPARGGVRVDYSITYGDHVRLDVFDVSGSRVRTLVDRAASSGTASSWWNGLDEIGQPVAAGRYFVRLVAHDVSRTRSIVLLR